MNRVKPFLSACISYSQAAFVPGRQILDNLIITHEYIHWLNHKRHGRDVYMALKIDMSKAYDRVEWNFLFAIMAKMGFCPIWIRWIYGCLKSMPFSFNVNGGKYGYICPSRGIRQRDPPSPYLFLFYAEGLSSLLRKACTNKKISGIRISREGPSISHLFLADDSLFFCKATEGETREIMRILQYYGQALGQEVNVEKSSLLLSKNIDPMIIANMTRLLGCIQVVQQSKYLGLPLVIGRSRNSTLRFLKERLTKKLTSWKGKLLSQAGIEVLLNLLHYPFLPMQCLFSNSPLVRAKKSIK